MNTPTRRIDLIDRHTPALPPGDYTITMRQTITIENQEKDTFSATRKFSVLGPRFTLDPQVIEAMFPPPGSLGDHANVLPHILLNRSTLPWERKPDDKGIDTQTPWLALLLFDEEEANNSPPQPLSLKEVKQLPADIQFPQPQEEKGDHDEDIITVIDVDATLLQHIMPTKEELQLLTHVRRATDGTGKPEGEELAVVICNRLPKKGRASTVHLVSVEGRYDNTKFKIVPAAGNKVRLVSLKSWRFACLDNKQSFGGLLKHLNHEVLCNIQDSDGEIRKYLNADSPGDAPPAALTQAFRQKSFQFKDCSARQITDGSNHYLISKQGKVYNQAGRDLHFSVPTPSSEAVSDEIKKTFSKQGHPLTEKATVAVVATAGEHWWLGTATQPEYFIHAEGDRFYVYHLDPDSSSTLRLPKIQNGMPEAQNAEHYLAMGCVPLPHAMRQGNKTVSWYHGPFVPGSNTTPDFSLPIRAADELVSYNSTYGMFDVSYAAAWELGRLLALQSKSFSVTLYNWKRAHAQAIKDAENQLTHLPFDGPAPSLDLPQTVSSWFEHLALLEGVPFSYLVPEERLLPPESIRFFQVDARWMECLQDGAFSIGRVLPADHIADNDKQKQNQLDQLLQVQASGFLLRSDVVAGWPGLLVDAYDAIIPGTEDIAEERVEPGKLPQPPTEMLKSFSEKGMVECRQWTIDNAGKHYDLLKRENNEIDVRQGPPDTPEFLFSLDASFETDLTAGKTSDALRQAFQAHKQDVGVNATPKASGWFISDTEHNTHFRVQEEPGGLQVYRQRKLPLLRMARLSPNILLCLFEGIVQTVDIHLKSETLHFGVDVANDEQLSPSSFTKQGKEIPWKDKDHRVIDVQKLAGQPSAASPAIFAKMMIEGVERVRFNATGAITASGAPTVVSLPPPTHLRLE